MTRSAPSSSGGHQRGQVVGRVGPVGVHLDDRASRHPRAPPRSRRCRPCPGLPCRRGARPRYAASSAARRSARSPVPSGEAVVDHQQRGSRAAQRGWRRRCPRGSRPRRRSAAPPRCRRSGRLSAVLGHRAPVYRRPAVRSATRLSVSRRVKTLRVACRPACRCPGRAPSSRRPCRPVLVLSTTLNWSAAELGDLPAGPCTWRSRAGWR